MLRATKQLIGGEAIRNQSLEAFAHVVAVDELYGLGADHHAQRATEINAVTLEQVRDVARKYFREPFRATVLVTPQASATA